MRPHKAIGHMAHLDGGRGLARLWEDVSVEQRLSLVTLGVRDLARARRFYEALGWTSGASPADDVVFFQTGCMIVALWGRDQLAEDTVVEDSGGWGGSHSPITPVRRRRSTLCWRKRRRREQGFRAPVQRRSGAATQASSSTPRAT